MRPVSRPPWNPRWAALDAGDAAAFALGEYCSACEVPLPLSRIGWNAGTGEVVPGRARAADWDNLLVLCPHCARATAGQTPLSWGSPLLPDRDATFALLGSAAPFGYQLSTVETTGTDGGEPDAAERVFVVPNGEAAADTVRLFGLNTAYQVDPRLRLALSADPAELPLGGEQRRQLIEFDDPRLMLRTEAWRYATRAAELYWQMTDDADRISWAQLLAQAISSRGFWSVWATVLTGTVRNLPLIASALAVPPGPARTSAHGEARDRLVAGAVRDFPATRGDWLPPPSDPSEQD